jgi:MFS transporter, Spinster family, sphingosine-1-phosphate transporter
MWEGSVEKSGVRHRPDGNEGARRLTAQQRVTGAWAIAVLGILTALNFVNYIDRSVLFAVQPLIQREFPGSDARFGLLTTAFFFCYMVTAPVTGWLADRYSRRWIMCAGALVWSAATLLTAVTHNFTELMIRHTLVGVGEATFVAISPSFLSDLYPEYRRGRVLAVYYLAIPVGTALGYLVGGALSVRWGWRAPFLVGAAPGALLGIALPFLPEPERGGVDRLAVTLERGTLLGLGRNAPFWTATMGMAMMTFAVGGMQVWMPTFLTRIRHVPLATANLRFGLMTLAAGISATVLGGWLGDRMEAARRGGNYLLSAIGMTLALPAVLVAVFRTGEGMYPAIFLGEFFLLLNTAPLNAAVLNSVSAPIRSTAFALNIFTIHLLGDAFSPSLMGYISDRSNMQVAFVAASVAIALSAAVLFLGVRCAPRLPQEGAPAPQGGPA